MFETVKMFVFKVLEWQRLYQFIILIVVLFILEV